MYAIKNNFLFQQAVGAVSCTGHGETIIRYNLGQRILQRIELLGENAQTAAESVFREMEKRLPHKAGSISLDKNGNVGIHFNALKMAWAYRKGDKIHSGIRRGDNFIEDA